VPLKVIEFFGFDPADSSERAMSIRTSEQCPFVGGQCIKAFKSGLISGACTVKPEKSGPVIVCPQRLYAGEYLVLKDIAVACFGQGVRLCRVPEDFASDGKDVQVFGKRWGKELRLPGRRKGGGYFVDWILALIGADRSLREFVAVEVQSMDTTGSYEWQIRTFLGLPPVPVKPANINWENVNKRILPQLIYKGHVLRREPLCKKGLFLVCPTPVYERIADRLGGPLLEYPPQSGAITFRWYDVAPDVSLGEPRGLHFGGQSVTTVDQVALAFTAPTRLPPARVYESAIRTQLH
jgi:hypothetical protein